MAGIYKRARSPYWWIRFQVNGKSYCEPTEYRATEKNEGKAKERARQRKAEVKNPESIEGLLDRMLARIDGLPDDEQQKKRRQIVARVQSGMRHRVLVADAWETWRHDPKVRKPDDTTLRMYEGRFRIFTDWLTATYPAVKYLHQITSSMADAYAVHLRTERNISQRNGSENGKNTVAPVLMSASSYRTHISLLKSMFRTFDRNGTATNVFENIDTSGAFQESKRNLEPDELRTVLVRAYAQRADSNLYYWLVIGLYTGLRLGDVVTLRWSEIDTEKGYVERLPLKRRNAQNRQKATVTVPIHPALAVVFGELRDRNGRHDEYVFPKDAQRYTRLGESRNGNEYYPDRLTITKEIQRHFIDAGIDIHRAGTGQRIERDENGKPLRDKRGRVTCKPQGKRGVVEVGFHSLRHSFVSLCAERNVPEVAMMELVGHGSPAMTRLYSHASAALKRQAIGSLPAYDMNTMPAAELDTQ